MSTLFLVGFIPNKLIGFIYCDPDKKLVKISHLDFWGRRKDVELPLNDLVPLSDLPAFPTDFMYYTLRRFSSTQTFKLNLKYGNVIDKKLFNTIFLNDNDVNKN